MVPCYGLPVFKFSLFKAFCPPFNKRAGERKEPAEISLAYLLALFLFPVQNKGLFFVCQPGGIFFNTSAGSLPSSMRYWISLFAIATSWLSLRSVLLRVPASLSLFLFSCLRLCIVCWACVRSRALSFCGLPGRASCIASSSAIIALFCRL